MTLSVRLTAAMIGLVLLTATTVGLVGYHTMTTTFVFTDPAAIVGAIVLVLTLAYSISRSMVQIARADAASPCGEPTALQLPATGEIDLLPSAPTDAIVTTTLDGIVKTWNPNAEHLFGFTAKQAIGGSIDIIVPDDRRTEIRAILDGIRRGEKGGDYQTVRVSKERNRLDALLSVSCIKSSSGVTIGAAMVMRRLADCGLSTEMFRQAVEACSCGLVMIDGDGKLIMVNTRTERLFCYLREELIGQPADIILPARLCAGYRSDFIKHSESDAPVDLPLFGKRKDGSEFPIDLSLNPIESGVGLMSLGVITDLSERNRIDHLKDEFVSTVSHELRTPLTSIAGALGLLAGQAAGSLPDSAARLIKIAHTNCQRLVRLVNDILDIKKIESGQTVIDLKRVDVLSLVEQTIEANRGFADSYRVVIHLDPASARGEARVDPDRLTQVVTNLLSNAIKFSPPGEKVVVLTEKTSDFIRISVRDRGRGIPETFKPHIFDKFAQADPSDPRQKGGTGLGLHIVKTIVEWFGGTVGFDDASDGGTIFRVDLPAWKQEPGADSDRERMDARILLCEHDASVAIAVCDRLREAGFSTDFALTIDEAVKNTTTNAYAAILVDIALSDGDGISLIQRLRAQPRYLNTPIIVVSAGPHRDPNDLRFATLNVLDWLKQPVDVDRLTQVLDRSIVRNSNKRPHVLHIGEDPGVLNSVAQALGGSAAVVSAESVEKAREALAANRFDMVVLDVTFAAASRFDLLADLYDSEGDAIPLIVFSVQGANRVFAEAVQKALTESRASIDRLIAILWKWIAAETGYARRIEDNT
jgi:PAS domain S-box-containing protein